jgi:predicted RNA-binding protein with PUA-like domain
MRKGKILPPGLGSTSEAQKQWAQETERQANEEYEDLDTESWEWALSNTKAEQEHLIRVRKAREALDAEDAAVAESLERLVVSGVWEQQKQEIKHVDEDTAMEDAPPSLPPLPISPEASGDEME